MKTFTIALMLFLQVCAVQAQSFNSPESVDFDYVRNRWIVGQNGSGQIHVLTPPSTLTPLVISGLPSGPHGIECVGDTVFACDGAFIKGFSLLTGASVFSLNLGATFLNGLTWDGGNFLYATDFSAKKIFRIDIAAGTFGEIASGLVQSPNGIIYDGMNNRCVFVNWGSNAPIKQISLADSSVTILLNTSIGNCDGITRAPDYSWYVTSWSPSSRLYKIDSAFSSAPVSVMTGLSSPADIDINTAGDSIGIPNSGTANNVVFYVIPTPDTTDTVSGAGLNDFDPLPARIYPNPSQESFTILLEQPIINGSISLFDPKGRLIVSSKMNGTVMIFDRGDLPAGNYVLEIIDDKKRRSRRKVILN